MLMEISIADWSLDKPRTRETFMALDEDFGEWLEDRIQDYYNGRAEAAEERRKARSGRSATSGVGSAGEAAGSSASPPSTA